MARIFGFCNPLLDISVKIPASDDSLLKKYKLKLDNVVLGDDEGLKHLIPEMMNMYPDSLEYSAGGSGLNSLRAAQLLLADGACKIVGSIGEDAFGEILEEKSRESGVLVHFNRSSSSKTGRCACLINGGNRSLVAFLDAARDFRVEHLNGVMGELETSAEMIYMTGFFLAVSPESVDRLLQAKGGRLKRRVFNLSAPFVCAAFPTKLAEIFQKVDILVGNYDELKAFSLNYYNDSGTSLQAIVERMHREFPDLLIIATQGSGPIIHSDDLSTPFIVPKLANESIVDTNGAGDAFVGGLLAYVLGGFPLLSALRVGCFLAAEVIKRPGFQLPTRQALDSFLETLCQ